MKRQFYDRNCAKWKTFSRKSFGFKEENLEEKIEILYFDF